jgi:hypothetical protein
MPLFATSRESLGKARATAHAMRGLAKASQPLPESILSRKMVFERQGREAIRKGFDEPPKK